MKQTLIALFFVSMLALMGCGSDEQVVTPPAQSEPSPAAEPAPSEQQEAQAAPAEEPAQAAPSAPSTDSVMEKYAAYEAEVGCALMRAGKDENPDAVLEVLAQAESVASKHGFTGAQVQENTAKYKEDPAFQDLTMDLMIEQCPDLKADIEAARA